MYYMDRSFFFHHCSWWKDCSITFTLKKEVQFLILLNSSSLTSWPILGEPLADYMVLHSYLIFNFRNVKWCSWYGVKWVAEWQDANTIQDKTQVLVLISIYFCKHLESNTCLVETSISAQQLFNWQLMSLYCWFSIKIVM